MAFRQARQTVIPGNPSPNDDEKEALRFLDRDFNQCFQQMRHYDGQLFEICKFSLLTDITLVGVGVGLIEFGLKEKVDLSGAVAAAFAVATVFGLFLFCLAVRNRVYFVQVARYINEQRGFFLKFKPLGFANMARMYVDPSQPPFLNWRSSQLWFVYIQSFMNSVLIAITLIQVTSGHELTAWIFLCSLFAIFVQLGCGIYYLGSRERRSAESAVFGKQERLT